MTNVSEKQHILDMLESGKISAQEACELLECLEQSDNPASSGEHVQLSSDKLKGKKLRVEVDGVAENAQKIFVNVSIPLVLARIADNIIEKCMPTVAEQELKKQGIDIKALNISEIVSTMESLDEDIVNADIDSEEGKFKVRIYVE